VLVGFLLAFAFVLPAIAQTNELQSSPLANRYLLVVETSRSMQRRAPGTLNALTDLLGSGFHGQIRPDDTLGVWTFGEDLYTGRFPLQHWSPQNQAAISKRIVDFVGEEKYEKQPNFDKLLPALNQLVKNSPFITIILVTDGEDKIQGTPFDSRINELFDDWRERQQKAQMPFLTVLRGKRGVVIDYTVNPAPWPVEMPPLPKELQQLEVAVQKAAPKPPAPTVAAPTVPPLIVHGKKPAPAKAAAVVSAFEATNTAAMSVTSTNTAVAQVPPPATATSIPAAPVGSSNPAPVPTAPSKSAPVPQPLAQVTPNPPVPASAPVARPPAPSSPVHRAAALSLTAPASRKGFWLAVAVPVVALLGLALVLFRRARPAPTASLITRSLERQGK
jgi:hypothetical protein